MHEKPKSRALRHPSTLPPSMSEEKSIREVRLEKLQHMRDLGHDPYAIEKFDATHTANQLLEDFENIGEATVRFAGRVVSLRPMGKAAFMHLSDGDAKIQCYVKKDIVGETPWGLFSLLDIGDHVAVEGRLFITKTGEK